MDVNFNFTKFAHFQDQIWRYIFSLFGMDKYIFSGKIR